LPPHKKVSSSEPPKLPEALHFELTHALFRHCSLPVHGEPSGRRGTHVCELASHIAFATHPLEKVPVQGWPSAIRGAQVPLLQ
jgi:hypothetical protein